MIISISERNQSISLIFCSGWQVSEIFFFVGVTLDNFGSSGRYGQMKNSSE